MKTHSFKLELPHGTTPLEAHNAGLHHIEKTLDLRFYADYQWGGSVQHPNMRDMMIHTYTYKA